MILAVFPYPISAQSNTTTTRATSTHRILSANIRVALPEDAANGVGWADRKDVCAQVILNQHADIVCLQEVLREQIADLKSSMPQFQSFGFAGPEMDANQTGYHGIAKNVIMYKSERYSLVSAGGYWLSDTPLIGGSKSWDTARARQLNWVRLKENKTGNEFRVMDTHLDHVAQGARENQIKLIIEESGVYAKDFPQIFAGDFNANAANPVYKLLMDAGWKDSWTAVRGTEDAGFTVHGFKGEKYPESRTKKIKPYSKIDFIFCHGPVMPTATKVVKDSIDGRYPSDHYFLWADVQM